MHTTERFVSTLMSTGRDKDRYLPKFGRFTLFHSRKVSYIHLSPVLFASGFAENACDSKLLTCYYS